MSTLYDVTVPVFRKYLSNLDAWIAKSIEHAQEKGFDAEVLTSARLAPDMHPFSRQVQIACDSAKWAAAKLSGQDGPSHPDTETTLAELRQRLATVDRYLESFTPEDFAGAEERRCAHVWMEGKSMKGSDYVREFALANFFFHLTTAYAILRHNGVPLGKIDYVGGITLE